MATKNGNGAAPAAAVRAPVMPLIPFVAAAYEHAEPAFDVSVTPGASGANLGPFDVPAYGFMRNITVLVEATGGTLGAGVLSPDYPFNLFDEITLLDVNGTPIYGPVTGYQAMMTNLVGGYSYFADPAGSPDYVGTINTVFALRIPVEISHHDALGSLGNQNAAAAYKVRLRTAPSATLFSTAPTTVPTYRVRGVLEAWSQPTATDLAGRPQETVPPRHGTTQFWSVSTNSLVAGANTVRVTRVGNLIRSLALIVRGPTGARVATTALPDPIEFRWDNRQILLEPRLLRRIRQAEGLNNSSQGASKLPDGVLLYSFDRTVLGHVGDGSPALWLPTVQSSRMEFVASNWPAGTVELLINDVAPVEIDQSQRYDDRNDTSFRPAVVGPVAS